MGITNYINGKSILLLGIIVGAGYLASKFPDESVLIGGIAIIIVIGIWVHQSYIQNKDE